LPVPVGSTGTPPSALVPPPEGRDVSIGKDPPAKQQVALKPSAVSVQDWAVPPAYRAQGFPSAQRGGVAQVLPPPPLVVPVQTRTSLTATQTGAWGGKQQAPLKPCSLLVQACIVAPGYPAQAAAPSVAQVGVTVLQPPPPVPAQGAAAEETAKQMGPPEGKQQAALYPVSPSVQLSRVAPG
jgi:hypothetical protein